LAAVERFAFHYGNCTDLSADASPRVLAFAPSDRAATWPQDLVEATKTGNFPLAFHARNMNESGVDGGHGNGFILSLA
jgi:hypothetical protein